MISLQSSAYAVSALVSSQMPAATKNGDATYAQSKPAADTQAGSVAGSAASGAPAGVQSPSAPPPPQKAEKSANPTDEATRALLLLETDDSDVAGKTTHEEFEAAARFLLESIDLRDEDEPAETGSNDSGISFDEAGTYRPAWIR